MKFAIRIVSKFPLLYLGERIKIGGHDTYFDRHCRYAAGIDYRSHYEVLRTPSGRMTHVRFFPRMRIMLMHTAALFSPLGRTASTTYMHEEKFWHLRSKNR
ncbi:hypothetical protein [Aurantiacibacter hainanensis]|uniref:hypothetical protein n=1 Tax=Aurantiacibacter hainanensis TaxID=3076114 RepID=UPI0030C689DF